MAMAARRAAPTRTDHLARALEASAKTRDALHEIDLRKCPTALRKEVKEARENSEALHKQLTNALRADAQQLARAS